jgi:hypothetical protein
MYSSSCAMRKESLFTDKKLFVWTCFAHELNRTWKLGCSPATVCTLVVEVSRYYTQNTYCGRNDTSLLFQFNATPFSYSKKSFFSLGQHFFHGFHKYSCKFLWFSQVFM